jgi:hypothetical protein
MGEHIAVRAGRRALEIIQDEGLNLSRVKVLAGASGAAKFLALTGIDRVLMTLFKGRTEPLYLIGTSIGAFRMAAYCQQDSVGALDRLEKAYIGQRYETRPSRADITRESWRILDAYIRDADIDAMLQHAIMRMHFLSNRCKGLVQSENLLIQGLGLALAAGVNCLSRNGLGWFFERALFCAPGQLPPFAGMDQFPMSTYSLTASNFKSALLSSGSIPIRMEGVSNIDGVPGVFRDGGILDYHLDIPFLAEAGGLVLYPHFYEFIIPGWLDKPLNRRPDPVHMQDVVIVAPSKQFVARLPYGKIPDRKDFVTFFRKDAARIAYWEKVVEKNKRLGDEFAEAMESGRIRRMVKPI